MFIHRLQEISDWGLDEESSVSTFGKYSSMWDSIINKVISLPFIENEDDRAIHNVLEFSSEAKAYLQTGAIMQFGLLIKSKMMDWWIAE